jgi:hypothetical protein
MIGSVLLDVVAVLSVPVVALLTMAAFLFSGGSKNSKNGGGM